MFCLGDNALITQYKGIKNNYLLLIRSTCSLLTSNGSGYEIFIDNNGKLIVGILTKKEYYATSVSTPSLIDKKWHLVTIGIIPPKRPFAYTQIFGYVDGHQRLGATIKFNAFTDVSIKTKKLKTTSTKSFKICFFSQPFAHCTIGVAYRKIRRTSGSTQKENEKLLSSISVDGGNSSPKGMFPSLMERAFLPQIVSQVKF